MYHGRPAWIVSRYRDIRAALLDPRLSADTIPALLKPAGSEEAAPVMFPRIDDPEHHRLRRMLTRDFTFRRCESMRPRIQELVDQHLDEMIRKGPPAELVRDFALPIPSLVIALLLGVPPEDLDFFQHHSTLGLETKTSDAQRAESLGAMFSYIEELVARREHDAIPDGGDPRRPAAPDSRSPQDDLLSRLVTDHVLTGQLDRGTAALNGAIMMLAGHETTANMISLGTVALLEHPDVFERLGQADNHDFVANTVEELLRYLSIVHAQVDRVATEDFVLGGQPISAGDMVVMNLPAGNWDGEFVDNPDELDAERNTRGHLAFGYGAHQCIGQNLARVEMQVAFATLARRLPSLKLAVSPDRLTFKEADIYGMKELPVTW